MFYDSNYCLGLVNDCLGSVKGRPFQAALAFEGIDQVHGSYGLPLGVLGVGDGVTDHVLQEHFENTTGLLVDQAGI